MASDYDSDDEDKVAAEAARQAASAQAAAAKAAKHAAAAKKKAAAAQKGPVRHKVDIDLGMSAYANAARVRARQPAAAA